VWFRTFRGFFCDSLLLVLLVPCIQWLVEYRDNEDRTTEQEEQEEEEK
jgi:hypothetical protein